MLFQLFGETFPNLIIFTVEKVNKFGYRIHAIKQEYFLLINSKNLFANTRVLQTIHKFYQRTQVNKDSWSNSTGPSVNNVKKAILRQSRSIKIQNSLTLRQQTTDLKIKTGSSILLFPDSDVAANCFGLRWASQYGCQK